MKFPENENAAVLKGLKRIHNPSIWDKLRGVDDLINRHPKIFTTIGAVFICVMVIVALNLGLERPWF